MFSEGVSIIILMLMYLSKIVRTTTKMIKVCKSFGKEEFQNLTEGACISYSSSAIGILEFCSDDCSKNYYFKSVMKKSEEHHMTSLNMTYTQVARAVFN
jgi:hypothetical protein